MQSNDFNFLIRVLLVFMATWRLASLFAFEKGPFDIFVKIRILVYKQTFRTDILGKIFVTLNDGLSCLWCNSVWFGMILSAFVARNLFEWFIIGLSASTMSIIMEGLINGKSNQKNNS